MIAARSSSDASRGDDHEQALLLDRALDEVVDVVLAVAELAHAAGRADVAHQAR